MVRTINYLKIIIANNWLEAKSIFLTVYSLASLFVENSYSAIAQFSGNYMRHAYFTNFLLSKATENAYTFDLNNFSIGSYFSYPEQNSVLLIQKDIFDKDISDLMSVYTDDRYKIKEFNKYYLIEKYE